MAISDENIKLHETAKTYVKAGYSIIPVATNGMKDPVWNLLPIDPETRTHVWGPYKTKIADSDDLKKWFLHNTCGIGIVGGPVSGNLERIDFDLPETYPDWKDILIDSGLSELFQKLVIVETPRDGIGHHVYYRCTEDPGNNKKLARYTNAQGENKASIETRGAAGYTVAPGSPLSCHKTGRPYKVVQGDIHNPPVLTPDERQILLSTARALTQLPGKVETEKDVSANPYDTEGLPGTAYNQSEDWRELLQGEGWTHISTHGEKENWCRPGKDGGTSATWNYKGSRVFFPFTSNGGLLEQETPYSPFGLYATLNNYGDNYKAAAAALKLMGYGNAPDIKIIAPDPTRRTITFEDPEPLPEDDQNQADQIPPIEETSPPVQATPAKITRDAYHLSDLLERFNDHADKLEQARLTGQPMGPITGFPLLDEELCGCIPPGLHVVSGDTGIGKTAICLQIAAQCGCPSLVVSCEMSSIELFRRVISRVNRVKLEQLKSPKLSFTAARLKDLAAETVNKAPLLFIADSTLKVWEPLSIIAKCKELKEQAGSEHILVVIDSLHTWASYYGGEEYERLNNALQAFRKITIELDCPLLFTSEQSMSANKLTKTGKNPGTAAPAGNRGISYGAETVINLEADGYDENGYPEKDMEYNIPLKVKLSKNRNGAIGKPVPMLFEGRFQNFKETYQ